MCIELSPPPNYEYTTIGPWWLVALDEGDRASAATYWVLESAVMYFWAGNHDNPTRRRTLVDARGITILGIERASEKSAMVGTRETMDATLALIEKDPDAGIDEKLEVLAMVERIREYNGGAT
jgi:hypothetical protein